MSIPISEYRKDREQRDRKKFINVVIVVCCVLGIIIIFIISAIISALRS